jgi:hypothetical protein
MCRFVPISGAVVAGVGAMIQAQADQVQELDMLK